jgi:hypothetical protein
MAEARRSRKELESKFLSEYSARRLEYDLLVSKIKVFIVLSISFGVISIFSTVTFYSSELMGLTFSISASIAGIIYALRTYLIASNETRYLRHSLNELSHEIILLDIDDVSGIHKFLDGPLDEIYVQKELCFGLYVFHAFFILTALLKYLGYWAVVS